jgi:hypothetical protein
MAARMAMIANDHEQFDEGEAAHPPRLRASARAVLFSDEEFHKG